MADGHGGPRPRHWTGRLWTNRVTTDGRLVPPGTIWPLIPDPLPLPVVWGSIGVVGTIDAVAELFPGVGVAIGTAALEPGRYSVGIDLHDAQWDDVDTDTGMVRMVSSGRLAGVTVLRPRR